MSERTRNTGPFLVGGEQNDTTPKPLQSQGRASTSGLRRVLLLQDRNPLLESTFRKGAPDVIDPRRQALSALIPAVDRRLVYPGRYPGLIHEAAQEPALDVIDVDSHEAGLGGPVGQGGARVHRIGLDHRFGRSMTHKDDEIHAAE